MSGSGGPLAHRLAERTERWSALDGPAERLAAAGEGALRSAGVKNVLSGSWLGHPLHPLATDAVIGAWGMAAVLDLGDARVFGRAADRLLGLGLLAAGPTAAAGLSDWADMTDARTRRMGLVHAASNVAALTLNAASLAARVGGRRRLGRQLTRGSMFVLGVGGYLGAHLSFARGVGVSVTAFSERLPEWTALPEPSELEPGLAEARLPGLRVLLRSSEGVAVGGNCTRCGAALAPVDVAEALRCPGDGTLFSVADGAVLEGPATTPLPRFETRREARWMEIRSA